MENTKRRHILYDRPFLGGMIALVLSFLFISNLGAIPDLALVILQDPTSGIAVPEETAALFRNAGNILTVFLALVCLLTHRLWFRRDGYRGCFTGPGLRNREAWLSVLCLLLLDVAINAAGAIFSGSLLLMPTVTTVLISLRAGVFEETAFRGIPVSIMMKNQPSRRRLWTAALLTAVVFGLVHMGNMTSGAALIGAVVQSVTALCLGLFLAAVYLRSGNILLTIVFHTLHDVIALTDPAQVTGVLTTASYSALELVIQAAIAAVYAAVGIFLLRKSKWEEIRSNWAKIWAE